MKPETETAARAQLEEAFKRMQQDGANVSTEAVSMLTMYFLSGAQWAFDNAWRERSSIIDPSQYMQ